MSAIVSYSFTFRAVISVFIQWYWHWLFQLSLASIWYVCSSVLQLHLPILELFFPSAAVPWVAFLWQWCLSWNMWHFFLALVCKSLNGRDWSKDFCPIRLRECVMQIECLMPVWSSLTEAIMLGASAYAQGLAEDLKDELPACDLLEHLGPLYNQSIWLDSCLYGWCRHHWSLSSSTALNRWWHTPMPPPGQLEPKASVVEPMQMEDTDFPSPSQAAQESKNRCKYCRQAGSLPLVKAKRQRPSHEGGNGMVPNSIPPMKGYSLQQCSFGEEARQLSCRPSSVWEQQVILSVKA